MRGVGEELRLANERPGRPWEVMDRGVPRALAGADKLARFVQGIRGSDRVKDSVKEKGEQELLAHYGLAAGSTLTRLGVLLLGTTADRRALGTAPLGVTPRNLLHASRRRNEGMARVFHDLGLMEREGSGY